MKIILALIFLFSSLQSNQVRPGLSVWFSAIDLSFAGGGRLLFNPNGRNIDLSNISNSKLFSTSYVFYPAGIQAQSASLSMLINDKFINTSINHVSYGTFEGYDENAVRTENYTSSDTWLRMGYTGDVFKKFPARYGVSNQMYVSKLEDHISASIYSSFGLVWTIKKYNLDIGATVNDILIIHDKLIEDINSMYFHIGLCKDLIYLPLKLCIDFQLNTSLNLNDCYLSGSFRVSENILLNLGTSTRKFAQNTQQSLSRTIFGSSGVGIFYKNEELVIGYGLYFYGSGGFSSGLDLRISF